MSKDIRLGHLWVMRLNMHHEGKRGNPYDQGSAYILGQMSLRGWYKGKDRNPILMRW
ncbi:MAG: hypothetical protein GY941_19615 [Planctomycetes bacterium]|nr:hypothetical protein [Planctomycetota bacterium]